MTTKTTKGSAKVTTPSIKKKFKNFKPIDPCRQIRTHKLGRF